VRILLAPSAFHPHLGGVEELTLRLALALSHLDHDVHVITNRWPLDLPETGVHEGIQITRLPFSAPSRNVSSIAKHLRARIDLSRELAARFADYDLVHVICASAQTAHLASFARRHGLPLVLTTQGETEMDAAGLYVHSRYARHVLRRAAAQAQELTACSLWTREATARLVPAFSDAEVILNGVDLDAIPQMAVPDGARVAAYGRHVPQKGFDLLIAAFRRVREAMPEAQLLIGGEGPQREQLEAMAGPGVVFLGGLNRDGVLALLRDARVVVVPSRIEPFGIVAAEALAAGRTVVYSRHGGLSEAVNETGISADPLIEEELATAVVQALQHPLPPSVCRAAVARLDWSLIAEEYERLYRRAIGGLATGTQQYRGSGAERS